MPKITALIHATNDALRIGRTLDSLRPCDEVLVIDHGSEDDTIRVAKEHGATVKKGIPGVEPGTYAMDARHDWVLCVLPSEALSEGLEAALFDWKESEPPQETTGYRVAVREEAGEGWRPLGMELRLVNRASLNWTDVLPPANHPTPTLPGELLRFSHPA